MRGTPWERFWPKVDASGDCWEWKGAINTGGYGTFYASSQRASYPAHRMAIELLVGPIPDGLVVDHLCRNTSCVNPDHLEAVTHQENIRRGRTGKYWSERTHCANGHTFDESNTAWAIHPTQGGPYRRCRACQRGWERAHRASKARTMRSAA